MPRNTAGIAIGIALWLLAPAAAFAAGDYSTAPFKETANPYAYGQAPVFMPDGKQVLFGKDFAAGDGNQIYSASFPTGTGLECLTCTGPDSSQSNVNGVPAVRPQGDWVVFSSWRGRYITFGSPGYGGIGSAIWAMHPDGTDQTQLTETQPQWLAGNNPSSNPGTFGSDEGFDDYHVYWSPDGQELEWAHFDGNLPTGGVGKWDVRVAHFQVTNGVPSLSNVHVVRPANGHWYETQWWAPDGSGFLYTETTDATDVPHLFFCRLVNDDSACQVTQLTSGASWDEQAIFTPDMKNVIFMSSRGRPGLFNTWAQTAQSLGLPNDYDWLLIAPLFEAGYLQPFGQEATDLYEVNLATRAVRRLTTDGDDGWITPEFTWDPTNHFLMWTENRFRDGYRYQFPPTAAGYAQQLQALAGSPYVPGPDLSPSGQGVAPLPVDQRTEIGVFNLGNGSAPRGPGHAKKPAHRKHRKHKRSRTDRRSKHHSSSQTP